MSATDIKKFLEICSQKVQDNIEIITPKDLGSDFLLHISDNNKLKDCTPQIGNRQADSEDRTVPRVCVASSLIGCMIGHAASENYFLNVEHTKEYRGGYYIYAFDFEYALKPNSKLVYDSKKTNEHWLVTYNKDTITYTPKCIGKFFIQSITYIAKSGSIPIPTDSILFIEVESKKPIKFNNNIELSKGYWKIEGPLFTTLRSLETTKPFTITEITKSEYNSVKISSADMLSEKLTLPFYTKW